MVQLLPLVERENVQIRASTQQAAGPATLGASRVALVRGLLLASPVIVVATALQFIEWAGG